jgi:phosphomannomutase
VTPAEVLDAARAWIDQDPDAETRADLEELVVGAVNGEQAASGALSERFSGRLEFGTAGLRGELGAGPMRMNRVLVSQAAAGLAAYLKAREEGPSIVIGYDGRKNSDVFAQDTAKLMAGAGVRAILLPRMLPTPVLAFAVRELGVSAGVMVTASHNPAADNGYKVYLGGDSEGAQIVSPADAEIAAEIHRVAHGSIITDLPRSTEFELADEAVVDAYIARTAALAGEPPAPLRVVYTAMHGVGWDTASRVFDAAGFPDVVPVTEQLSPDPTFPTVAFPNPEEPGALDLSFEVATEANAELILANDPDADRLAVAIPSGDGGWRRLTGNEIGSWLGWRAAERMSRGGEHGTLAASIVSSPALSRIAAEYGHGYADTLTGFKWVSRVPGLAFGYEEALGYLVDPAKIRDKDGISAAVAFLALASELKAAGVSFAEHERAFAEKFGAFASGQISIRVSDLKEIPAITSRLRAEPPTAIGGIAVASVDDFTVGVDGFPKGDILRYALEGGSRVIVRPSGTEPKLKVYLDATSSAGTADERIAAAQATLDTLDRGVRALLAV